MAYATVDDTRIEFEVQGQGPPVVFIHGALIADSARPLLSEAPFADRYQLITYHRRGYCGSDHPTTPIPVEQHAADCRALIEHLGLKQAHLVGHSYGGSIALQVATEHPDLVRSLALLEPALLIGESGPGYREALSLGMKRFRELDPATVVEQFFAPRLGAGFRTWLDPVIPDAFDQAVSDASTWFELEIPAFLEWSFGEAEVRRVSQPTLLVLGEESNALWPRFQDTFEHLAKLLPAAESYVLPRANHGLAMQNPHDLAMALDSFFIRHPAAGGA